MEMGSIACDTNWFSVRRSGLFKAGLQVAAVGGYERDVVHR